ncbi:archaeosortase/exosortase family protein, partial [Candidatus Woesearchaeota archaeon]|nr:archaeosortase/exosortase family protein [Candidatus Woesearchaeota archaeon]
MKLNVDFTFKPDIPSELFLLFRIPLIFLISSLVFYVIARRKLLAVRKPDSIPRIRTILFVLMNLMMYLVFFKFNVFLQKNPLVVMESKLFYALTWYLLFFLTVTPAVLAFFKYQYLKDFAKKFKYEILISVIIAVIFRYIYYFLSLSWKFFSGTVAYFVYYLLKITYSDVVLLESVGSPTIYLKNFGARIFYQCSGIEGMSLFITLFLILIIIEWNRIVKWKALYLLFLGTLGAFLLNTLRVYFIFIIGSEFSKEFALGFFHSNVGWILFSVYFIVFELLTINWMSTRVDHKVKHLKKRIKKHGVKHKRKPIKKTAKKVTKKSTKKTTKRAKKKVVKKTSKKK